MHARELRRWISFIAMTACLFFCIPDLIAQTGSGGTIQGTITDPENAVVPGAKVTVTNIDTGVVTKVQSTSAGYYAAPALIPGTYTVQIEKSGFKNYVQENITVNALAVLGINAKLSLGEATESVTISTALPDLETENASLTTSMENETYTDLPLNMNGSQRDPTAFAALAPGASGGGRLGTFNGAGGRNSDADSGVVVYVDGLQFSTGDNRPLSLAVSVDAVDQFQVTTSGTNAAQTGLGSQNYNIKHGTNVFHGSMYDYVRNTAFDSWGFMAPSVTVTKPDGTKVRQNKPAEHQTEMGLTLGGPLKQKKIFFFLSGELYHYTKFVNPYYQTVPTDNMRAGNFQELCDSTKLAAATPSCTYPIYDPTTMKQTGSKYVASPFNYGGNLNVMNPGKISPIAKNMLQFLPHANVSGVYKNNLLMSHPTGASNYGISERFDYVLNQKQRISLIGNSGKRGFIGYDYASNSTLGLPYVNATLVSEFFNSAILEHTYILTSNMVNQFKVGFVRTNTPIKNPSEMNSKLYSATSMGIGNLPTGDAANAFPAATFSGGEYGASTWYSKSSQIDLNNQFALHDDISWAHGKHLITAGLDLTAYQKNVSSFTGQAAPMSFTFSSKATAGFATTSGISLISKSGDPMASFLLGAVDSTSVTTQTFSTLGTRYKSFSPYVQDDWKLLPNLTLNLGLRWDLFQLPYEVQNRASYMDTSLPNSAANNYLGAMAYLGYGANFVGRRTPGSTYHGNIGPRVGMAYTPRVGMVVRAGFGINYGRNGYSSIMPGAAGFTTKTPFSSSVGGEQPAFYLNSNLDTPNTSLPAWSSATTLLSTVNAGNNCTSSKSSCTAANVSMSPKGVSVRVPTVYNWNFGIEQALTNKLVLSVAYAGSASHFLTSSKSYTGTDAKYNVIGQYLSNYPNDVDTATGRTFLADAQARFPGISLPYASYGGSSASISHMLSPFPQYGTVDEMFGPYGDADYHSLQTTLKQQSWKGLSYTASFVWSKTMGNTGSYRANGDYIPANIMFDGKAYRTDDLEHTLVAGDQRLLFRIYGEYKLPFGTGSLGGNNWYVRQVSRGWKLSGIYKLGSGGSMGYPGSTIALNPNFHGPIRINGKFGKGYLAGMSSAVSPRYIDINGFTLVPKYMLSNVKAYAPYNLKTPHTTNLDMAIMRSFPVWKQSQFSFRAEVFNLTNHTEFGSPSMSWPSSCSYDATAVDFGQGGGTCTPTSSDVFGQVSSQSNNARDWQFSGRITV